VEGFADADASVEVGVADAEALCCSCDAFSSDQLASGAREKLVALVVRASSASARDS
jgi:hypothetical protein